MEGKADDAKPRSNEYVSPLMTDFYQISMGVRHVAVCVQVACSRVTSREAAKRRAASCSVLPPGPQTPRAVCDSPSRLTSL